MKRDMTSSTDNEDAIYSKDYDKEMPPRIFEYKGNMNLSVRGISTGTIYSFSFHGHQLEVDYFDSFAMMAERDLKLVSKV